MSEHRRQHLISLLRESEGPLTGTEIAARLRVSRQVIVQDVAILRAAGQDITATPQGYILAGRGAPVAQRAVLASRHTREQTEDELTALVDVGVKVIDVVVEHALYGELRGLLMLESREDVRHFIRRMEETQAPLLSALTKGVHLHTVEFSRPEALARAREELRQRGYLLSDRDEE